MSVFKSSSIALIGLVGELISVEVDISDGLPSFTLLGLPDAALNESRERVRTALSNSNFKWQNKKTTVALSPAWLPKSGSGFDLPIAIAILGAQGILNESEVCGKIFLGELGLEGTVKAVKGVLPALIHAKKIGVKVAIIPRANFSETIYLEDLEVVPVASLQETIDFLKTGVKSRIEPDEIKYESKVIDMSEVVGQAVARKLMEIAAIGGHNLLLIGPPGT